MKILLIDNGTLHLQELKEQLQEHVVTVQSFSQTIAEEQFDCIILSGGHGLRVSRNKLAYANELQCILATEKPLLGICLGHQLLCTAYNGLLQRLDKRAQGILRVEKLINDPLLEGMTSFDVHESHAWSVKDVQTLTILAKSKNGVEMVKHPTKPHYGVQFHPEVIVDKPQGLLILKRFLSFAQEATAIEKE